MNKNLLCLVCLDIAANFCVYLTYEDYEALAVCFLKGFGIYGVITGDLTSIIGHVLLSCIIALTRTIQFLHGFKFYIICLNVYSSMTCFLLLKNICSDIVVNTELGFKLGVLC